MSLLKKVLRKYQQFLHNFFLVPELSIDHSQQILDKIKVIPSLQKVSYCQMFMHFLVFKFLYFNFSFQVEEKENQFHVIKYFAWRVGLEKFSLVKLFEKHFGSFSQPSKRLIKPDLDVRENSSRNIIFLDSGSLLTKNISFIQRVHKTMDRNILKSHYDNTIDRTENSKHFVDFSREKNKKTYSIEGFAKTKKNYFGKLKKDYVRKRILSANKKLIDGELSKMEERKQEFDKLVGYQSEMKSQDNRVIKSERLKMKRGEPIFLNHFNKKFLKMQTMEVR